MFKQNVNDTPKSCSVSDDAKVTCMNLGITIASKLDWLASAVDKDPTAGEVVFWRAQYITTVLFPGQFQCPCDHVSLLSHKIYLRTGNLSVVGGTSVPQRTGNPSVGLCCNKQVQLPWPDCVSNCRCSPTPVQGVAFQECESHRSLRSTKTPGYSLPHEFNQESSFLEVG